jgi:hypothetical protein
LRFQYRHGDGSAQVLSVDLLDGERRPVEIVDSGSQLFLRLHGLILRELENPVFGFMIRNRHGVNVFGTNTEQLDLRFGPVECGDLFEVTFAFDCWLVPETYSLTVAIHSVDGKSYDWLDGVLFFRVTSDKLMEGIANLNASAEVHKINASLENVSSINLVHNAER